MAELAMLAAQLRLDIGDALAGFDGGGAGHGAQYGFRAWFRVAVLHGIGHHDPGWAVASLPNSGDVWNRSMSSKRGTNQ